MLIYKKYIAKSIFYPLLTFSCVLTFLVWVTQIFKLLYLIDKGVNFSEFFKIVILILPSLFFMISPLISVLSVIYTYNKLQNQRQIIILKMTGISNFSIAKPALMIATLITLFTYYISFYLMPLSYNTLKNNLSNFREYYVSNIIDEKIFNQISKHITIYVDKKKPNGLLEGIILFDSQNLNQRSVLFAKTGKIITNNHTPIFHLSDGFKHSFDQNGNLTKLSFDDLSVEIKNNKNNKNDRDKTSLELYVDEMLWPDDKLSTNKKIRLMIDGHQRIIWPLFNYCLVFLALSIFLVHQYNRESNIKQIIYSTIPVIIVTYFHFTFQKIAYQQPIYIYGCYINLFLCILFSIWQIRKT